MASRLNSINPAVFKAFLLNTQEQKGANMRKSLLLLLMPVIFLAGCDSRYRYPCQDPTNWDQQICKKPYCSADGTCPDDLQHYEKKPDGSAFSPAKPAAKGECK